MWVSSLRRAVDDLWDAAPIETMSGVEPYQHTATQIDQLIEDVIEEGRELYHAGYMQALKDIEAEMKANLIGPLRQEKQEERARARSTYIAERVNTDPEGNE